MAERRGLLAHRLPAAPDGFGGDEYLSYGDDGYHCALAPSERAVIDNRASAQLAEQRSSDEELRDDFYFGEEEVEEEEEEEDDAEEDEVRDED